LPDNAKPLVLTLFEIHRRNSVGHVVAPFSVVEHLDVMKVIRAWILADWANLATNPFELEQMEAADSRGVVGHRKTRFDPFSRSHVLTVGVF
jgi:hypothetical protein